MPEAMREKDKDKGSKWLVDHHGDAILRLGGTTDLVRWQAAAADLVLPAKLPDGLIFAGRAGQECPESQVVEVATYPENRAAEQALRDLLLVSLIRNEVPNVLVLVLRPKGQLHVPDHALRPASDGVTQLGGRWKVVELWTVPAQPVLAAADPGMMPWVPLMQAADPPEVVLRRCRAVIDQHAPPEERDQLITVTQVFTRLRYKDPNLLSILGGKKAMIESPLIREITAERSHKHILKLLATRFGPVPPDLEAAVRSILDETVLDAAHHIWPRSARTWSTSGGRYGRSPGLRSPGTRPTSPSPSWRNRAITAEMLDRLSGTRTGQGQSVAGTAEALRPRVVPLSSTPQLGACCGRQGAGGFDHAASPDRRPPRPRRRADHVRARPPGD